MTKQVAISLLLIVWWTSLARTQDTGDGRTAEEKSVGLEASPAGALEEKTDEEKREIIIEHADRMIVEIENNIIIFEGNVRLKQGNTLITGDTIRQIKSDDGDLVVGDGNISLVDDKDNSTMTMTSQHLEYNSRTRHALITGNPVLEERSKTDEKEYRIVKAREMEVFMEENRSIARGDVEVIQEDLIVTGQLLEHLGDEEVAVVTGSPEVRQGDNIFRGSVMRFNVPQQRLELTEVEGVVIETAPQEESPVEEASPANTSPKDFSTGQ